MSSLKRKHNSDSQDQQELNPNSSNSNIAPSPGQSRLRKELMAFVRNPPEGICIDPQNLEQLNNDGVMNAWIINMKGADDTLYQGENFTLRFKFCDDFPFQSPEVVFTGKNIPVHPHIYSNGHICLSILSDDWSPALTVSSVCLSILSMLSSCTEKKKPADDESYVRDTKKGSPKDTHWTFHDDKV